MPARLVGQLAREGSDFTTVLGHQAQARAIKAGGMGYWTGLHGGSIFDDVLHVGVLGARFRSGRSRR